MPTVAREPGRNLATPRILVVGVGGLGCPVAELLHASTRIKVVVSSCGFDSFVDYMDGNIKGWTSDRYMPRLLEYQLESIPFDFHELIGALAPRPVFVNAPIGDTNFKWRSVDRIIAAARPVYRLFDAESNLRVEHPGCAHSFPLEMRKQAYEIIDSALKP